MFFVFVDLEKAFDWVSRKVVCFALRWKGGPECLVDGVMSLYKGCKNAVSTDGALSSSFSLESWCPSRSFLNPLLLIMVMNVLTEDVRDGPLMELLYADDLALCGESLDGLMYKYGQEKTAVEVKGMRVNIGKTKGMQSLFGKKSSALKVDPCDVFGEQVGRNSSQCTKH